MSNAEFVYTTYIKSTPQKVWNAITSSEFTRQYWHVEMKSDWKKGSPWKSLLVSDGNCNMQGEVLESTPPKRLVMTWFKPESASDKSEHSRVTFEIETIEDMVRLNVIHDKLKTGSDMANGISRGWPVVLSSLKSMLETGKALNTLVLHNCAQQAAPRKAASGC